MRTPLFFAVIAACSTAPLLAQAAQSAPAATVEQALPAGAAAEIVREVIAVVQKSYVHPDRTDSIVKRLEAGLATGRYSTTNPQQLAERMSVDLKESSGNDGHMYIGFKPEEAAARASGPNGPTSGDQSFFLRQMAQANHGVTELSVLPGNVRYMNLSEWFWDPKTTPRVYDDAMRFLRDGDAIIIDISGNGGGSADAVNYLVSYFMEPDQTLMTFREGPDEVEVTRTQRIAAGRIAGKPLFLLTGPRSGSASEEFASHIKHFKLGTLVGKTTAGAGNPNSLFPIPHGFVLSVSTGLALHPVTGKGWEGEGVSPHIEADMSKAREVAHLAALKAQLASAPPDERQKLEWLIGAFPQEETAAAAPRELHAFAGSYEGDRKVVERSGRLYWQRAGGPEIELVWLGGTRFALGDRFGTRVEFAGSGLKILRPGVEPESAARLAG